MTNTTNTTTNTVTMDSIKAGKCQFNATSAKNFRAVLAKWHNATFEIADELLQKSDRVKALRTLISTDKSLLEKLGKGESIIDKRTPSEIQAEIDGYQSKIDHENAAMAEFRKAQADRLSKAEDLVSKSMYEAYSKSFEDEITYGLSIAQFLSDNGVEPCDDTIKVLISAVGKKSASARNMCKSGKHNTVFGYTQWRKIFLGELCDIMGDTLPLYKFTYVLKDERKNK